VLSSHFQIFGCLVKTVAACAFLAALSFSAQAAESCPDFSLFYLPSVTFQNSQSNDNQVDWPLLERQLAGIKLDCLESSEFFALHGAAQLNSGLINESLESLERALLLDPNNGAAQIDYGQALFQQGQLFMALELNERLLQREDLPKNLQPALRVRQQAWKALTRQKSFQVDALGGYDNNLNGAPSPDQVTLTLSGEAIPLTLDTDFRPEGGPYLNLRLGSRYRTLAPNHQHNWATEVRARTSEDSASNLVQLNSRYAYINADDDHSWQVSGGLSHLNFSGSALFSGLDASVRYQTNGSAVCKPYYDVAVQYQNYHEQVFLNGVESKLSAGLRCPLGQASGSHRLSAEIGMLNNRALDSTRLGGNRNGWQFKADWQKPAAGGLLRAEVSHIQLDDSKGYSELLASGADRDLNRSYMLVQFRKPITALGRNSSLLINIYRQSQNSNIEFFRTDSTSAEIGLSWSF
jgi:tetratricopeptide (TPR) repeat protein